jgi:hypothetical protein
MRFFAISEANVADLYLVSMGFRYTGQDAALQRVPSYGMSAPIETDAAVAQW